MGNVAIHEPEALLASVAADRPGSVDFLEGALAGQAGGHLPGRTLRHLIEWAMRERQTCTLKVASQERTGVLSFEAGRILSAETAERDGARAATEILSWRNVRVGVLRSAEAAAARQAKEGGLGMLLDRFCGDVEGLIATGVVRRKDGWTAEWRSLDSRLDATAAGCFAGIVDSHLAAVEQLGMGPAWGETEDILITTARAYLLIRLLGESHYHWLAVSSTANNLALCRLAMRSHEPFLLSELADLEESSEA